MKETDLIRKGHKLIIVGFSLGVFYWIVDSFIDTFLSGNTFTDMLFHPGWTNAFGRSFVAFLFIAFSVYGRYIFTKRKLVEEKLKDSEERFRSTFELAAVGVAHVGTDGRFLRLNKKFCDILGYTRDELLQKTFQDITYPEDHSSYFDQASRLLAGKIQSYSMEKRYIRKDGTHVYVNLTGSVVRGNSRINDYFIAILEDITERKQTMEALEEKTRLSGILMDALPCVALLLRPSTREIVASNQAAVKVGAVPGAQCFATWGQRETPCPWCLASSLWATGKAQHMEVEALGIVWDAHWIPVSPDLYMHYAIDITDYKQAIVELRRSKEFNETVLNTMTDAISIIDVNDFRIIDTNQAYIGSYGLKKEDLLGRHCYEISHNRTEPCAPPYDICPLQEVLGTGRNSIVEHKHLLKNGQIQFVEVSASPIKDETGNIISIVHVARDISERKRSEERLAKLNNCMLGFGTDSIENINRLTALSGELMGAACALYNRLDRGMLCSWGQWNTPLGYNPVDKPEGHICYDTINNGTDEVIVIRNLPETHYKNTDPNVMAYNLKTYIGKAVKFGEDYVGSLCVVFQNDIFPDDEDKKFISLIASAIGIEEKRKQTEEALKESEEKYHALMNDAGDAIILADVNGKVLEVNKKMEELLGYTKEDFSNMNITQIHPKEELERTIAAFKVCANLNDGRILRKDGKIIPVDITGSDIEYAGRKVIQGIFRDITERKQAEEQIKASLKEKEVLLREIHHRVKNNMQIISSLLNLQAGYIEDTKYLEMFKESQNRIYTMSLVHENLYMSKDITKINFKDYIHNLANGVFQSYRSRSNNILLNLNIEDAELGIDSAIPCGLIINELVTNSIKYAFPDEKKGEIKINLGKIDENEYELTVSDNGIGIPEDQDFRKTKTLGLYLVSMLAEDQLSGKIKLDRSKGTEFRIRFGEGK